MQLKNNNHMDAECNLVFFLANRDFNSCPGRSFSITHLQYVVKLPLEE